MNKIFLWIFFLSVAWLLVSVTYAFGFAFALSVAFIFTLGTVHGYLGGYTDRGRELEQWVIDEVKRRVGALK